MPCFEVVPRFQAGHCDDRLQCVAREFLVAASELGLGAGERSPSLWCKAYRSTFRGPSREGEITEQAFAERTRGSRVGTFPEPPPHGSYLLLSTRDGAASRCCRSRPWWNGTIAPYH